MPARTGQPCRLRIPRRACLGLGYACGNEVTGPAQDEMTPKWTIYPRPRLCALDWPSRMEVDVKLS